MGCQVGSQCPSIIEYVKNRDRWLDKTEGDLLKAAVLPGVKAVSEWNRWRSEVPFEDIDPAVQRLLPLLYQNLTAFGVEESIIAKYKGVYRRTWVDNQIAFQNLVPVFQSFRDADIATIILKGGAMISGYYQNPGLRPVDEIELLIPTNRAPDAVSKLYALGWQSENSGSIESKNDRYLSSKASHRFSSQDGGNIKIRWRFSLVKGKGFIDADYWQHARETHIAGEEVYIYHPTEQLMEVCIDGAWGGSEPKIQLLADAAVIVQQASSEIEWDRLLHITKKQRLFFPIYQTLSILAGLLDMPIPPELIKKLEGMEVSTAEVQEHQIRSAAHGLLGSLPTDWFDYLRLTQDELGVPLVPSYTGFPNYLEGKWALDHTWQLPFEAIRKGIRRLRKRLV